ncbi:hypothetical protein MSG28_006547, partial [Choristoneura fumiferana]
LPKSTSNRIVSILGLFELSVGESPRAEGASELAAAQLAVQHVNQRALLPGYRLHLITNDTKCDPGVGVDRFFHALYTERESRMVMLLGSACSEVTESIAKIVPYWNIVQFGWDTVTAFSQNEEVYSLAVNELVTQLEAANITCAASITFAETLKRTSNKSLYFISIDLELDTRIIIGSFSQDMIPKIFCETNEMFHREMAAAGVSVSPFAPQTYDAVWAIALSLSKAEQLWRSLEMTHHNGTLLKGGAMLGLSHFDYNRKDMAEEFLNQLANLSFLGVSMACGGCARAQWGGGGGVPAARRVLVLRVDSVWAPARLAVAALAAAGVALAVGFLANRSGVCKTKLLQDTPLIALVLALLVLDGVLVTLWAALDPMQRQLKNLTQEISAADRSVVYQPQIEVCKSQNTTGWLCALYAYKGLLLLVGVYMAWETRNVKISALNDSKYIGISVYSVVITSTSVVVIGTIISERATLAYITITSLILITTTSTLCLLFLPKIIAIRSKSEDDPVIQSLGLRLECKTRRFVTDETQELHFRIEIQNKVYKREVAALDREIGRLERLLAEPLESAILPPVIPRASWPSAEHCRGRNSVSFSSQPKLNYRKSQPAIDLYSLCLNKREEHHGLLSRIKSFFGSRPSSRKASTMSIADPSGQGIAAALKMHVGMIAGLVPGTRKHSMVLSCNTLNVPYPEHKLRRESYAKSGPIIRITDDEPSCSKYPDRGPQKYIAEPETKQILVKQDLNIQKVFNRKMRRTSGPKNFTDGDKDLFSQLAVPK